jgi:ribosomal protein S18 acetylase RimI-like enzyme
MKTKTGAQQVSNYEIRIIESIEGVEQLRSIWEKLQCHPNSDIDSYLVNLRARDNILMPYVMLLLADGQPRAILIGRIEETRFEFKFGFKTLRGPKLRQLVIIYRGYLGDSSMGAVEFLVAELMRTFSKKKVDAIWFYCIQVESELYRAVTTAPGFFGRDHGIQLNYHWQTKLPSTGIDELFKKISSKHRYWLRRLPKVLEKDHPNKVTYRCFTEKNEVEQLCKDCEEVARSTYHRSLGSGFTDNEHGRRRLGLWADRQSLRGYVAYIDGRPVAFWLGTLYGKTFHLDFTGYHPDYRKYELGTILFVKMIEDLINKQVDELDYGLGALWYKERFGELSWPEAPVYIFAPTCKGVSINLVRMGLTIFSRFVKWTLAKLGVFRGVKNRLRNRLTKSQPVRDASV